MMGYHQIRLESSAIPKTAVKTKYGSFEFTGLPLGLTNAPGSFMSRVNEIFFRYINDFFVVYLDYILIYSRTWDEHLKHLRKVLQRLRKKQFYGKLKKCVFGVEELEYLGFNLKSNKLLVDPTKICLKKHGRPLRVDLTFSHS